MTDPAAGRRGVRHGRGGARAGRGARRQRRHHQGHPDPAHGRRRLGRGDRHQPDRRLPRGQARHQGHARGRRGAGSSSSPRSSACSARPARSTTPRPRPASSGWPARSPASSARAAITANVVAPGFVETDMTAVLSEDACRPRSAQVPARPARPAVERWPQRSPCSHPTRRGVRHRRPSDPCRRRTRHGSLRSWDFSTASASWSPASPWTPRSASRWRASRRRRAPTSC